MVMDTQMFIDTRKEDQDFPGHLLRKRGVLPCGSRVCLRCHKQCGVVLAAYLSGLDEEQELKPEDL